MAEYLTEPKFKRRLLATFFVRFHMMLILGTVGLSGVVISKTLLAAGIGSMMARYFIAVIVAYVGFFLLMRLWLWYIGISPHARRQLARSQSRSSSFDGGDIPLDLGSAGRGSSGGGSGWGGFGGGRSGGGGASDSWLVNADPTIKTSAIFEPKGGGGSSPGKWSSGFDLDLGDDGCLGILVLFLLIALILGVAGAGIYLIYQAPVIFAEAAFQAAMAAGLIKATNQMDRIGWAGSVWKATWIPFTIILITATAFGWAAHEYCPEATRVAEVFTICR